MLFRRCGRFVVRAGVGAALVATMALVGCGGAGQSQSAESPVEQSAETAEATETGTERTDMQPSSEFMQAALDEAYQGIEAGDGGPFGSVIVKDGEIVGSGHNRVLAENDPTCHGEMEAIRDACRTLGTYDLSGCDLYTTAEPCPMCLGAVMWANIDAVYYGCTREDSDSIGFRDDAFYRQLAGEEETVAVEEFERDACLQLFEDYEAKNAQRY